MKKNLLTSLKELLKALGGEKSDKTNIIGVVDEITEQIESTPQSTPLPSVTINDEDKALIIKNGQWTKDFLTITFNSDNTKKLDKNYKYIRDCMRNGYLCIIKNPDFDDTRTVTSNIEFIVQVYDNENHGGTVFVVQSISLDQQGNIIVKKYLTTGINSKPQLVTQ